MKTIYVCEGCGAYFDKENDARMCETVSLPKTPLKVGDIVTTGQQFGWFNGDAAWVVNRKNLDRPRGVVTFYYVVTAIDTEQHRRRYHVRTRAMTSVTGYASGWTYDEGHYRLRKSRKAPVEVLAAATRMRGKATKLL